MVGGNDELLALIRVARILNRVLRRRDRDGNGFASRHNGPICDLNACRQAVQSIPDISWRHFIRQRSISKSSAHDDLRLLFPSVFAKREGDLICQDSYPIKYPFATAVAPFCNTLIFFHRPRMP